MNATTVVKEEKQNSAGTQDVYLRQLDIISKEKFSYPICIIGAGATGSFLTLALAKMGLNNIKLWDFDSVELHNFPNQIFRLQDLNGLKAEKTAEIVKDFTGTKIKFSNSKFELQPANGIVVLGVDSMKSRKEIYNRLKKMKDVKFVIDPRSGAENGRVYTVDMTSAGEQKFYEQYFYDDSRTEPTPCTAQAVIYSVLFLSAIISNQIKRLLMNQAYLKEIIYDMTSYMMLTK